MCGRNGRGHQTLAGSRCRRKISDLCGRMAPSHQTTFMNWITITWPMVAAACLTLGLIELRIGLAQQPPRDARLLFALNAFAMAAGGAVELALTQVDTVSSAEMLHHARRISQCVVLVTLVGFVRSYFGTGNKWFALTVVFLSAIGLLGGLLPGPFNTGAHSVTGLRTIDVIGGAPWSWLTACAAPGSISCIWQP